MKTFREFFAMIGPVLSAKIPEVCLLGHVETLFGCDSRPVFSGTNNILDRFHIVAKVNEALDDVRSAEAKTNEGRRIRTSPHEGRVGVF